jgi:hypothetical protein
MRYRLILIFTHGEIRGISGDWRTCEEQGKISMSPTCGYRIEVASD